MVKNSSRANAAPETPVTGRQFLTGMKEIAEFVGRSEPTVLKHKREYPGMPIRLVGGIWIGDPVALNKFYRALAVGDTEAYLDAPPREPEPAPAAAEPADGGEEAGQEGKA